MAQIDHHYQHWDGAHENIWRRRWTIALEGLRTCMAQKWLKRFPYEDIDAFVERIPFKETRLYVKLVLKNYAIYKALSDDTDA